MTPSKFNGGSGGGESCGDLNLVFKNEEMGGRDTLSLSDSASSMSNEFVREEIEVLESPDTLGMGDSEEEEREEVREGGGETVSLLPLKNSCELDIEELEELRED